MTTPLSNLLIDLLTDPEGRAALDDDPAGVLADHGWGDLTPRDVGDALRLVTSSGPAAAAHAGADLPDQPSNWSEVLDPVLEATAELDSWEIDATTPLVAGAIEPETFDFAPAPLVGVDPDLVGDGADDPFLRSDDAASDSAPDVAGDGPAEPAAADDDIDLSFDDAATAAQPSAEETADELTDSPFDGPADALGPQVEWSVDDLDAPEASESFVELDTDDVTETDGGTWGDLDTDLD